MDDTEVKYVLEAALLAAGKPLSLDKLLELFAGKAPDVDRKLVRAGLEALAADYAGRGLQLLEVSSGWRIQVRSTMSAWLLPLWEERAPRYSRALLETLALIAYRQPITRGEIEEVRGVAVNTNIIRTMLERGWIRVVGHREVPGKPEMFGTTREFLDYFGLRSIDEMPILAEIREDGPMPDPQADFLDQIPANPDAPEAYAAEDPAPSMDGAEPGRGAGVARSESDVTQDVDETDAAAGEVANDDDRAAADDLDAEQGMEVVLAGLEEVGADAERLQPDSN